MEHFERFNVQPKQKSDNVSAELRSQGNKKFDKRLWNEAMELYNQSLRFAVIGSETMSLAYANRSACFFELKMYEKCLVDIDLAIKANYPKRLMSKLERRRADCLERIEKAGGPVEYLPKLCFPPNSNYPEMADVLKIECNDEFGRFITATADIQVGQTVVIDEIFSSRRTTESTVCETCLKDKMNFVPCDQCADEMFCSSCEANDYHSFVLDEGDCNKNLKREFQWLFTAIEMFPNVESLMEFVESSLKREETPQSTNNMMSKLSEFFKLTIDVPSNVHPNLLSLAVGAYRVSRLKLKNMFTEEQHKHFLMHLIVYHSFVTHANAFSRSNDCGLFIVSSYFNHSCAPNLSFTDCGNLRIGTILRPIKKGQQLFATYLGEDRRNQPTYLRQLYLGKQFGFQCQCEKCKVQSSLSHGSSLLYEPRYHSLEKEFAKEPITKKESFELRQKSIELLKKFGNTVPWTMELENIAKVYRTATNEIFN